MSKQNMILRPVAEPQVIENAFSQDQHRRLLDVVRGAGPYSRCLMGTHPRAVSAAAR